MALNSKETALDNFHNCTVNLNTIKVFYLPNEAQ